MLDSNDNGCRARPQDCEGLSGKDDLFTIALDRCDEATQAAIRIQAEAAGVSVAAFVERITMHALRRIADDVLDDHMVSR